MSDPTDTIDEITQIDVPHPKSGKLTTFIEKDTALMLFERQQRTFVGIMRENHNSLEREMRDGFTTIRKVVMGVGASVTLFGVLAFGIFAIYLGGNMKTTLPGGATVEMTQGSD